MRPELLGLLACVLLSSPMAAKATDALVGDKAWRQLTDTTNLTWTEVNQVCGSGPCAGVISGISFDGWRWASIDEVRELFDLLIEPQAVNFPATPWNLRRYYIPDLDAVFATYFEPTIEYYVDGVLETEYLLGISSSRDGSEAWGGGFENRVPIYKWPSARTDMIFSFTTPVDQRNSTSGVWMYRLVPEPASLALLGLGLAGLGLSRRRKA